jgi:hypothetical protein
MGLRRNDLLLNFHQQLLCFDQRQTQAGDVNGSVADFRVAAA